MFKNKAYQKALALFACLIGLFVLLVLAFGLVDHLLNETEIGVRGDTEANEPRVDGVFYQSAWYSLKQNVETILVIGVDSSYDEGSGRQDSKQADFLALLVIDHETKSMVVLHLNRDTMTDIPITDIAGKEYGTSYSQLALAHTYGSDENARCRNTVKAVGNLLYGIRIDHYISITMDAVAILNDSVGGVTVELLDDFTDIDAAYVKGAVVTLAGDQALTYVRARQSLEDSSNLSRMTRQAQYIGALAEAYMNQTNAENSFETIWKINAYMASDCTINQLSDFSEKLKEYTYKGIQSLAGEAKLGEEYIEYYLDEDAAQAAVIALFYTLSGNDQS